MKLLNVLVVYTTPRSREQRLSLETVKKILKRLSINFKLANRDRLSKKQFNNIDLVIAVGGDGTFLRAAQFVERQLMFGVNADVKNKEGFFMKSNKKNFEKKLKNVINGKARIRKLPRLEAYLDNKKIDALALNEFFIGPRKSYHAAKYVIQIDGRKERQKSSGILVTTPTGSYAWAKSCSGRILPLESSSFQFVVREPYEGNVFKKYKFKYGTLNRNKKITVFSEMLDGILIADSVNREYGLKEGSRAAIKLSKKSVNVVWQ